MMEMGVDHSCSPSIGWPFVVPAGAGVDSDHYALRRRQSKNPERQREAAAQDVTGQNLHLPCGKVAARRSAARPGRESSGRPNDRRFPPRAPLVHNPPPAGRVDMSASRFGPHGASRLGSWARADGPHGKLAQTLGPNDRSLTPLSWIAFFTGHAAAVVQHFPKNSIDLVVNSAALLDGGGLPITGKNPWPSYAYLDDMQSVWTQCSRVLRPNTANCASTRRSCRKYRRR